ncbi:serine/threonine-protein kinase [Streptosporangium sp. NPDC051023]|uniref:serine/threonine-protein kinase n=1 Tax=Streptosporangium sp. NPDC051023 TaxID=3155410 RepID=UPI0034501EE1
MEHVAAHDALPGDPGRIGPYTIVSRLGEGGQGVVYLARSGNGAPVALKVLRTDLDPGARQRFTREFQVLQRVSGFCTARLLDADVTSTPPYLVSEYVPGPSLHSYVREHDPRGEAELERLAVATLTALTAIHRAGIVHRDIKPQNILMGTDGPRIIDFSIARDAEPAFTPHSGSAVRGRGQDPVVLGTPAFMAPEQLSDGRVGVSADVFAWGATMVYAATGAYPFGGGASAEVLYRVLHTEPDLGSPVMLSGALRTLVASCLAKDPAQPPSAQDLVHSIMDQGRADSPTLALPRRRGNLSAPSVLAPTPPVPTPAFNRGRRLTRRQTLTAAAPATVGLITWRLWPSGEPRSGTSPSSATATDAVRNSERPPAYAEEARAQAEIAFETVHGFDYRTLGDDYRKIREDIYGRAGQELGAKLVKNAPWIRTNKVVQTGIPGGSGIVTASENRVAVLVHGEITTTTGGKNPRHELRPLVMEMLLVGDLWRLEHIWPRIPEPDSVEQSSGEWPNGSARTMMSAASGTTGAGVRAVAFDESSDPARVTLLVLGTDGTLNRVTVVRAGDAFTVESTKKLSPA